MKHLTREQRYTISEMRSSGYKQQEIADVIGKDKSVVSRELKRNCDMRSGEYKSDLAQRKYEHRQRIKPKKIRFTETVKHLVDTWIGDDYSPEQIAGRAKIDNIECVSHERIISMYGKTKKKEVCYINVSGIKAESIVNEELQKTPGESSKTGLIFL